MRGVVLFIMAAALLLPPAVCAAQDELRGADTGDPRAHMAALVREALRSPDAPESWAGLAQGLSTMRAGETRDVTPRGVLAAVRIADSLAFAPLSPAETASGIGEGKGENQARMGSRMILGLALAAMDPLAGLLPLGVAALVLGALIATGWIPLRAGGKGRRPPNRRRSHGRPAVTERASSAGSRKKRTDARSMALSLAEHGMPASEVARRTGMAQDEVAVVLALHRRGQAAGGNIHPYQRSA